MHRLALHEKAEKIEARVRQHKNRGLRRQLSRNMFTKNSQSLKRGLKYGELRLGGSHDGEYHKISEIMQQEG